MTKDKIKWIIKRISYIQKMLRLGITETTVFISGKKEKIVIDENVLTVIEIINEIIENEDTEWLKFLFKEIKKGRSDISIICNSPIERTKYYEMKKDFIDKIFQCCIYKGLVDYKDILKTEIG